MSNITDSHWQDLCMEILLTVDSTDTQNLESFLLLSK